MKNVGFSHRKRLIVSQGNQSFKVYILSDSLERTVIIFYITIYAELLVGILADCKTSFTEQKNPQRTDGISAIELENSNHNNRQSLIYRGESQK